VFLSVALYTSLWRTVQKADIWSCGVILYAMLYGCYPFSNKEPDYIRKIVTATYHMPPDVQVPAPHRPLLTTSFAKLSPPCFAYTLTTLSTSVHAVPQRGGMVSESKCALRLENRNVHGRCTVSAASASLRSTRRQSGLKIFDASCAQGAARGQAIADAADGAGQATGMTL